MKDVMAREECAKKMFAKLNVKKIPEYFNWALEIFEDLHVKENPDKKALIWADINTLETKVYSYRTLSQTANQLINFFLKSGVKKR